MSNISPEQPVIKEILRDSGSTVDIIDSNGDVLAVDASTLDMEPVSDIEKIVTEMDAEIADYVGRKKAYDAAVIRYDNSVELRQQSGRYTYEQAAQMLADQKGTYPPVEPEKPLSMQF